MSPPVGSPEDDSKPLGRLDRQRRNQLNKNCLTPLPCHEVVPAGETTTAEQGWGEEMQRRSMAGLLATALMFFAGQAAAKGGGSKGSSGGSRSSSGGRSPSAGSSRGTGSNPNSHPTSGYTRKDGTYVAPHRQTDPNGTTRDNYNTRGNYNPYNGQTGTRSPKD
jgi:hypothetical protein